ncbi:DNA-methyltransferase [Aliarcobacter cryaerophilus]|uniref:DNA-methyltransferase n=1 Tax=Aliarcobacter cryaerophilus TaxID=28198 RepID=UPI0021B3DA12|nr:site-specific DNA-methyltransferase [Aliarcobacter cryaerophilus]MCT7515025.1 site-specific DNA-methyltransferase [Aliarcobacter cryaerophilus]
MIEFNKIYQANSDIFLKDLLNTGFKFDLILTDPPYNLKKDFGNDSDNLTLDEFLEINNNRIGYLKSLLSNDGSIIWFGIHHYIGFIQTIMYQHELHYRRMNIWFYENGFSRSKKTLQTQYEPFLWFSKNDKKWTFNLDDVRVPYKSKDRLKNPIYYKDSKGNKKKWEPNPKGAMRGDIWQFPTLAGSLYKQERTSHPTQKPESLITEIIKAFCPKNKFGFYEGIILDPFHGSGTLGVCCEKLNKEGHKIQWIGIELEKKWIDISNKRIQDIYK